jgi:hypothetical protein
LTNKERELLQRAFDMLETIYPPKYFGIEFPCMNDRTLEALQLMDEIKKLLNGKGSSSDRCSEGAP